MNILGISGLHHSARYKQEHWPGLDAREYRIAQGYDSAAALVCDGRIVAAAAQERFSRKKHTGEFPIDAINYCLREAGLSIDDIDEIAHGFDYTSFWQMYSLNSESMGLFERVFSKEALVRLVRRWFPDFEAENVHPVGHHLAHAASAAFTSGWEDCLVVVNDAMGEVQSLSVYDF
ncbi:MAG TPA: carbamoyltransferase N-terminal domain-containing protein, partial [Terriglobales bacterium]